MFEQLSETGFTSFDQLSQSLNTNPGYLKVALRVLESISWIDTNAQQDIKLAPNSQFLQQVPNNLAELTCFPFKDLASPDQLRLQDRQAYQGWVRIVFHDRGNDNETIATYLKGCLLVPSILELKEKHEASKGLVDLLKNTHVKIQEDLLPKLESLEWVQRVDGTFQDTDLGHFIFDRIFSLASVYSYGDFGKIVGSLSVLLDADTAVVRS